MKVRKILLLVLAALVIWPVAATGHISVVPQEATTGVETPFVIRIPNETGAEMTTARVSFPSGVRVAGPLTPPAGWTVNPLAGQGTDLAGADFDGRLAPGGQLEVTVLATPLEPGQAVWRVEQTLADGSRVLWTANPDPSSVAEPGADEAGPAVATTITGASLAEEVPEPAPEPESAPGGATAPEGPEVTPSDAAGEGDAADPGVADESDGGSDVQAWIVVALAAVAIAALGAAGWLWSNRPMDLPPDD